MMSLDAVVFAAAVLIHLHVNVVIVVGLLDDLL